MTRVLQGDRSIDDDVTRDDTCHDFLVNFLNGTTDAKDECQAMYKAWEVADCKDYKNDGKQRSLEEVASFLSSQDDLEQSLEDPDNIANVTDDDIMIDDAFERWECCSSISDFYSKHCSNESHFDAYKLLGIVLVLIVCGMMKSFLRIANIQWIPDAGACIIVGAIVGGILRLARTNLVQDKLLAFDNDLFLQIMLPPIVFEAAISIDKRAFRRDLFPILTFAVFGTGFSAVAIGYITHTLSSIGNPDNGLPWLDSLLFGSLMSSIDPVATLGILSSVGVSQGDTLYTLIFGESLLNDGVSIVLFESLVRHMGDSSVVDRATWNDTILHFLFVTSLSLVIGAACGGICTLYFWALQGKQSAVGEVALFFAWALVPYYISEGLGLSGIISIMVTGFVMDYFVIGGHQSDEGEWMEYMTMRCQSNEHGNHPVEPYFERIKIACCKAFSGRGLITSRSRHHVGFVAEVLSNIMETAIFAYLGLFLFNDRVWDFKMTFSGLFACVSSRAVMVVLLSLVVNACVWLDLESLLLRLLRCLFQRSPTVSTLEDDSVYSYTRNYLDLKTQMILFSAGVRGAVSYALVQNIPVYDAVTKHGSNFKAELRSMTSASIVVILFGFGALTYFTVQRDLNRDREGAAGTLHHRLLSMSLDSVADGNEEDADYNSSFEIEGRPNGRRDPLRQHE